MRKYFYFKYQNANGELIEYSRRTTEKGAYNYFMSSCRKACAMYINNGSSTIAIHGYNNIFNYLTKWYR